MAAPERVGPLASIVGLSIDVTGLPGAVGDLVSIGPTPRASRSRRWSRSRPTRCAACRWVRCTDYGQGCPCAATGRALDDAHGAPTSRQGARRPRSPHRRQGARNMAPRAPVPPSRHRARRSIVHAVDTPLGSGRAGARHDRHRRPRPAHRPVRRLRRRQVLPAVDDRARHRRRGLRHRPGRASAAARCGSSSRTTWGPRASPARSSSWPPPTSRRWCALRAAFVATRIAE